ncbi:MAG: hypothetical protein LIO96_13540 [Lachnospiraceae bacterium]|nr:hypothetical protein [Lachnospiraceae bacterium]
MSNYTKKRHKNHTLQRFLLILIVLVIVVLIAFFFVIRPLKEKLVSSVAEKIIETQISSITGSDVDAEEIMEIISEEDQETIEEICNDHLDTQTITDIFSYVAQGDTASLKSYLHESLTEEEMEEIYEIYEKYQDEIYECLK